MKKYIFGKKIIIAVLLVITGFCQKTAACDRYIEFGGGYPRLTYTDQASPSYYVSGIIGYRFCTPIGCPLKTELETRYSQTEENIVWSAFGIHVDHRLKTHSISMLANGIIELPTYSRWTPYAGAGIGYEYNHLSTSGSGSTDVFVTLAERHKHSPLIQGIVGIKYALSPSCYLKADYRSATALSNHPARARVQNVGAGIGMAF